MSTFVNTLSCRQTVPEHEKRLKPEGVWGKNRYSLKALNTPLNRFFVSAVQAFRYAQT